MLGGGRGRLTIASKKLSSLDGEGVFRVLDDIIPRLSGEDTIFGMASDILVGVNMNGDFSSSKSSSRSSCNFPERFEGGGGGAEKWRGLSGS